MIRPLQQIALFLIKIIIKRIPSASPVIFYLFRSLFGATVSLINVVGIVPVFTALWKIRTLIRRGNTDLSILNNTAIYPNLNAFVVNTIIPLILPYWKECLKHPKLFKHLYTFFFCTSLLGSMKYILYFTCRFTIGSVLSAIGILWNESLQGISMLKDFSYWVVELIETKTKFRIPRLPTIENIKNIKNPISFEDSTYLSVLGLVILGVVGLITITLITESYSPGFFNKIPYIGSYIQWIPDTIVSVSVNTYNYASDGLHSIYE